MRGRGQPALGFELRTVLGAQGAGDARPVLHAEELVHLRKLGPQLVGIALREASDDEQPLDPPGLLGRRSPQDHVDRLLLGIADESARVDYHHLGIGAIAVRRHSVAGGLKLRHQVLRIDRILRTAEGYDVNFLHGRTMH